MFKFTGKFKAIKFNSGAWSKTREEAVATQVRQAARAWLRAARDAVPVWTGQVRGSLVLAQGDSGPLGEYLNVAQELNPLASRIQNLKNPLTGALKAYYSFPTGQHKYLFNYTNNIDYFLYNDENSRSAKYRQQIDAPWRARAKANAAFKEYLRATGLKRIPGLKSAIVFTEDKI